jgi:putative transcriptional regulator
MIVNHLPDILERKGVSIRELARLTGVTYTTIRALYHGERRSVQLPVLDAICRVLDVHPGDVYGWASETAPARPPAQPAAPVAATRGKDERRDDWSVWS